MALIEETINPFEGEASNSDTVDVFEPSAPRPMDPDRAQAKAVSYDFSLGVLSPGREAIFSDLLNAREDQLTERMRRLEMIKHDQERQSRFDAFLKTRASNPDNPPLTQGEYDDLVKKPQDELDYIIKNPDTYFNKKKAQRFISEVWDGLDQTGPAGDVDKLGLNKYITKVNGFRDLAFEYEQKAKDQSFLGAVANSAEYLFTPLSWWNTLNAVEGAPTSSILRGTNTKEQIDYLLSIEDPDEALRQARAALETMYQANPYDARDFAYALNSYTPGDEQTENLFQVFNMATGITAGVGIRTARGFVTAATRPGATIPGVLSESGQVLQGAFSRTLTRVTEAADPSASGARVNSIDDLLSEVQSIANPEAILANNNRLDIEATNRLNESLTKGSEALMNIMTDVNNINRLRPGTAAYNTALAETRRLLFEQYPDLSGSIAAIRPAPADYNRLTNTDFIEVTIQRPGTTELFASADEAQQFADFAGIARPTIRQAGDGFYISLTKAVDETLPSVRAALAQDVSRNATPNTLMGNLLGYFRTKDEVLPSDINQSLKQAAFGAERIANVATSVVADSMKKLRRSQIEDLSRLAEHQNRVIDPVTGNRGRFSRDIGDLDAEYMRMHNRLPSVDEIDAYFKMVQVNDFDWIMRNLNIYKGKSRLGVENFELPLAGAKSKVPPTVEGRVFDLDRMFNIKDDAGILIWDDTAQRAPYYLRKNQMTQADRQALAALMEEEGATLIQVSNFGEDAIRRYPLVTENLPEGTINYVVARKVKSSPLSLRQIPYQPGGHVNLASRYYVSQPIMTGYTVRGARVEVYHGDRNALAFETRQEAQEYARRMDQARILLRDGNMEGLDQFLRNNLPYHTDRFVEMFGPNGLDVNQSFMARTTGATLDQEYKLGQNATARGVTFENRAVSPHHVLNDDVNLRYAMERGESINTIDPDAGRGVLRPARQLDPYTTMERAAANVARGRYLDDLKIKSSERFTREFGAVLEGDAEELQRFPMDTLVNARFNMNHPNKELLARAKNYRRAVLEFMQYSSPSQQVVEGIVRRTAESVLNRGVGNRQAVLNVWDALETRDPVSFFRSAAFFIHMGFFNIRQLLMQGQGVVHTAAIEGMSRASRGATMGSLMRPLMLRGDSAVLDHAAQMANKVTGINPDHFRESYMALQRSGFQNVGGEVTGYEHVLAPRITPVAPFGKVMENGLMFYRAGERANRLTAWNAAYLRWRETNPLAKFTPQAQREVLERADLLTVNMTRASNASWNQGPISVPTQFMSFHTRLMDQMLGRRLTVPEKARILATYSALYGVPAGVAGTTLGTFWPVNEQARQTAIQMGYDPEDNAFSQAFFNGIPQATISYLSDGEVNPAISSSFGPGGLSFFKDLLFNPRDKTPVQLAAGPGGQAIVEGLSTALKLAKQGYLTSEPALLAMIGVASDDDTILPLTKHDFLPFIQTISTADQAVAGYLAYNTGAYFAKNNIDIVDDGYDNPWNAFFSGVLGVDPQPVVDYWAKVNVSKTIDEAQKSARQEAEKYIRLATNDQISSEERIGYYNRAKAALIAGGFTETQKMNIMSKTMTRAMRTSMDRIDEELKNATQDRYEAYIKKIMKSPSGEAE